MKLYNYYRSSASYRVRIALHFKSVSFEYIPIHLLKAEQDSLEFKKLNSLGQVPLLSHNNLILSQSFAIIEYLEEAYPTPPLLPQTPEEKALIRQFAQIINCTQPLQNLSTLEFLKNKFKISEEQKNLWLKKWLYPCFESLESFLSKHSGSYCFKDSFTLADTFLVPQVYTAKRFGLDLTSFPNIERINNFLETLEFIKKAHPLAQIDTPLE